MSSKSFEGLNLWPDLEFSLSLVSLCVCLCMSLIMNEVSRNWLAECVSPYGFSVCFAELIV